MSSGRLYYWVFSEIKVANIKFNLKCTIWRPAVRGYT